MAPEVFESRLKECLADLPGVVVIRDDTLVVGHGETDSEALDNHDQNVIGLLERTRKMNLKLNNSKVKRREAEVKFMGHVISKDGLKPDPDKVAALADIQAGSAHLTWLCELPLQILTETFRSLCTLKRAYHKSSQVHLGKATR